MIVVDLTILMPFVAGTDGRLQASRVSTRDPVWIVPELWRLRACEWAVRHVRQAGGSARDAHGLILVADMLVRESHEEIGIPEILAIAYETDLSIEQAVYVQTARRIGTDLVTSDAAVLAACPDVAAPADTFGAP